MKIVISVFSIWYIIAYPLAGIMTISNLSTLGSVGWWKDNSYNNELYQIILIYLISFLTHFFSLFLACKFLKFGMQTKFFRADKAINQISNRLLMYPLLLVICTGTLYVQYFYGWGIHGLPPIKENFGNGIGFTVLFRDLMIPILFILAITNGKKYSYFNYGVYCLLMFVFSLFSLSKVTLIVWFFVLIYISSKSKFSKSQYLISTTFFIISFAVSTLIRTYYLNQEDAINGQMIYIKLLDLLSGEIDLIELDDHILNNNYLIIFAQSMMERVLGFRSLAAAIFYEGEYLWHSNYFSYFQNQAISGSVVPLQLISSTDWRGGFGIDYISTLFLVGPFTLIFFVYFSIYFYCIGLLHKISSRYGILIIFIGTLIATRYLIDGNLNLFVGISQLLIFLIIILYFLGVICARKKSYP